MQWQRSVAPVLAGTRGCSVTFKGGTLKSNKKKHFSTQCVQLNRWIPSLETKQCLILHTPPNESQRYLPSLKSYHWWRWRGEWEKGNRLTYPTRWNHSQEWLSQFKAEQLCQQHVILAVLPQDHCTFRKCGWQGSTYSSSWVKGQTPSQRSVLAIWVTTLPKLVQGV